MSKRRSLAALGWGLAGLLAVSGTPASGQDPDPDLLSRHVPSDAWLTLELNDAAACYDALLGFFLPLPDDLPPAIKLFAGAASLGVGQAFGMPPREALAAIAPGRAVLVAVPSGGALRWVILAEHLRGLEPGGLLRVRAT